MSIKLLKQDSDTLLSASRANEIVEACNSFLGMRAIAPLILTKGQDGGEWVLSLDPDAVKNPDDLTGGNTLKGNASQSFTATCPAGTTGGPLTITVSANTIYASTQFVANQKALQAAEGIALSSITCATGGVIDGEVRCMAKLSDGSIIIGGQFQTVFGIVRIGMAKLTNSFVLMTPEWKFDQTPIGFGNLDTISGIAIDGSDNIYVSGNFRAVDLLAWQFLALLTPNGGVPGSYLSSTFIPEAFGGFPSGSFSGCGFIYYDLASTRILTLGGFSTYNGVTRNGAFELSATGTDTGGFIPSGWSCVAPLFTSQNMLCGMLRVDNIMVWNVTATASTITNTMCKVGATGTINLSFVLDPRLNGGPEYPFACIFDNDGGVNYLYVCGKSIATLALLTRRSLLRIIYSTGTYSGWAMEGVGFDDDCLSLGVLAGLGKMICVGHFSKYDGVSVGPYICRIDKSTGLLDSTFTAHTNDVIDQVIIESGNNILICGNFTQVNGVARSRIARMDQDGNLL